MKAIRRIPTFLVCTSALTLVTAAASAQSFDSGQVARNTALQASPRYVEVLSATSARVSPSTVATRMPSVHRGYAASPRGLEEVQAFTSVAPSADKARSKPSIQSLQRHQGLAASPRQAEELQAYQLPGSSIGPAATYEIAPLK